MLIKDFHGDSYYLMEVIAIMLKYLKDQLINHLSRTVTPLKASQFEWVITIPEIWRSRGRHMMREAAYPVWKVEFKCDKFPQSISVSITIILNI